MNAKTARLAFRASLPVMAGYLVLGAGFGVLLQDRGYGFFWAFLMSLSIYAGSLQYASLDLISGGASLITTALMTLMINARHFFYGLSMLDRYQDAGKEKPYLIFSLTDETYSLMCAPVPEEADPRQFRLLVSVFDHCYWVAGSAIGGLLGPILPCHDGAVHGDFSGAVAVLEEPCSRFDRTGDFGGMSGGAGPGPVRDPVHGFIHPDPGRPAAETGGGRRCPVISMCCCRSW